MRDIALFPVIRDRRRLEENRELGGIDLRPERVHARIVEGDVEAVARITVEREIDRAQTERLVGAIEFLEVFCRIGARFVHLQHGGEFVRILVLRERVVVVHRAVAPAGLQYCVVDAGIEHLRQHQFRRRDDLLHADRHILRMVIFAVDGEVQPAVIADAEIHVLQSGPGIVALFKEKLAGELFAVARAIDAGRRARLYFLDVAAVDFAGRVPARALPSFERHARGNR